MAEGLEPIQGLWIGPRLSMVERLSIASFLAHGHPYHLYVYEDVAGVPAGTELRDATEIVPREQIFTYQTGPGKGSYAAFSDVFRFELLLERGGWWCDTDVICLKPLAFPTAHVFCGERHRSGLRKLNGGIMRAPAGSPAMRRCYETSRRIGDKAVWGQIGPRLLTREVYLHWIPRELLRLRWPLASIQPPHVFQPVDWWDAAGLVDPDRTFDLSGSSTVHLWNEVWRQHGLDKNATYPPDCLFETLKRQYAQ